MRYFILLSFFFFFFFLVFGQCCSMGSPGSGQEGMIILPKNNLRVYSFYKHGYNETYFRQNIRLVNYGAFSHSSYDFAGLQVGYGITNRLTIEHEMGYFFDKQIRYHDPELDALTRSGYGMSNGLLSLHYALWTSRTSASELAISGGVKYPFSTDPLYVKGVQMPVELQPSTGAWGFVGRAVYSMPLGQTGYMLFFQHRFETNSRNSYNYKYGSAHQTSVSFGIPLLSNAMATLQVRNEYRTSDITPTAARLASEGNNLVYFTPTIGYLLPGEINLAVFADIPVYKYYFGEQLSHQFAAGVSITRNFSLQKKPALPDQRNL